MGTQLMSSACQNVNKSSICIVLFSNFFKPAKFGALQKIKVVPFQKIIQSYDYTYSIINDLSMRKRLKFAAKKEENSWCNDAMIVKKSDEIWQSNWNKERLAKERRKSYHNSCKVSYHQIWKWGRRRSYRRLSQASFWKRPESFWLQKSSPRWGWIMKLQNCPNGSFFHEL